MDEQTIYGQEEHSVAFLLTEYSRLMEAFQKVEESGERPVNFFIGLTTIVTGAFLAFVEEGVLNEPAVLVAGLTVLLLFGFTTLARIIRRNITSHECLRAAGRIRRYFSDRDPEICDYLYYPPVDSKPFRKKKWADVLTVGTGGLLENVALVNSLLVAGIVGLPGYAYAGVSAGYLFAALGAIGAWVGQFIYVKRRYEEEERERRSAIKFPE